jgi:hypothetical protein
VGVLLTGLSAFPKVLGGLARNLNLGPEICYLMVGGTLISGLVFEISHLVSRLRDENVMLAQRIAILEYELNNTEARKSVERHSPAFQTSYGELSRDKTPPVSGPKSR